MDSIQNVCVDLPKPINQAFAGLGLTLTISAIALSIIGLAASSSGTFHAIVQFGATTNGILLGTSTFAFILELIWVAALCKNTKKSSASQPETSQVKEEVSSIDLLNKPTPSQPETSQAKPLVISLPELPAETILNILGFLNPFELLEVGEVCKAGRRLTSDSVLWNDFDLRTISPLLKIFDESDWITHVDLSKYGLSVEDTPPFDQRSAFPLIKRCLSLSIEGNAGVTLLTIPKGLSLNKLVKLAKDPKLGNIKQLIDISYIVSREFGDREIPNTYRIVITNNIFSESRALSSSDLEILVKTLGCEKPKTLEIVALLVATFMSSGACLYHSGTYTYCLEKFDIVDDTLNPPIINTLQSVVGDFTAEGRFIMCNYHNEYFHMRSDIPANYIGGGGGVFSIL